MRGLCDAAVAGACVVLAAPLHATYDAVTARERVGLAHKAAVSHGSVHCDAAAAPQLSAEAGLHEEVDHGNTVPRGKAA